MATGHLITYLNLTFLGDINLSHLYDTCRQLITDRQVELLTSQLSVKLLVLLQIIQDNLLDQLILLSVCRPLAYLDGVIIQFFQRFAGKLSTLSDNLRIHIVFNTLRNLAVCKH